MTTTCDGGVPSVSCWKVPVTYSRWHVLNLPYALYTLVWLALKSSYTLSFWSPLRRIKGDNSVSAVPAATVNFFFEKVSIVVKHMQLTFMNRSARAIILLNLTWVKDGITCRSSTLISTLKLLEAFQVIFRTISNIEVNSLRTGNVEYHIVLDIAKWLYRWD